MGGGWVWPGSVAGILFLLGSLGAALTAIRRHFRLSVIVTVGILACGFLSFRLAERWREARLANTAKHVMSQVEALQTRFPDQDVLEAIKADPKVGEGLPRGFGEEGVRAVSFQLELHGIDNGSNLVFNPDKSIEQYIGPDSRIDDRAEGWNPYRPLITAQPVRCKKLGGGWYLITFT